MSITNQLSDLYGSELYGRTDIFDTIERYNDSVDDKSDAVSWPLLLSGNDYHGSWPQSVTSQNYQSADIKIMIYGQETLGWGWDRKRDAYNRHVPFKSIVDAYDNFFLSGCSLNSYGSPFWIFIRDIIELLAERNSDKKFGYLWNNVIKMGCNSGKKGLPANKANCKKFYDSIIKPYFHPLVAKEHEILKPDYIVFLTGPNYDNAIVDIFGKPQRDSFSGFDEKHLCEILIPNVKKSIRSYHPGYLRRKKHTDKYLDRIVDEITRDIKG